MMRNSNSNDLLCPETTPNPDGPAAGARHDDPFDDPEFLVAWLERTIDAIERDDPMNLRRTELYRWAAAAGFKDVDLRHLEEPDFWEMRFKRGTNVECTNVAQAERWLGFLARGCLCRFVPGQFIAIVDGDRVAARFRLEFREQHG